MTKCKKFLCYAPFSSQNAAQKLNRAAEAARYCCLALLHQPDVEFHSFADGFQANALIVAVDGSALFGG